MTRLADAILSGAVTAGYTTQMVDIRRGGQQGFAPNLAEYASNQAYVQRNLVALLIEAPRGFKFLPDPPFWVAALKSIIELHPKSISGMAAGLEVEFVENAVSGGGEMQQDFINVKRARTNPTFTWVDKTGRPIQTFFYEWITNLLADPDSKVANIATLGGARPTDLLSDMTGATVLFFEPDPMHKTIVKAWLTTNMMPKSTGDITGKRDLSADMESGEFSVDFTGMSQSSLGVRLFAQTILDSINFTNANPNLAPAFVNAISADVVAANTGYAVGAAALGTSAIASRG